MEELKNAQKMAKKFKKDAKIIQNVMDLVRDERGLAWLKGQGRGAIDQAACNQYIRGRGLKTTYENFCKAQILLEERPDLFENGY